ncbi:hypothetical protein SprV_0200696300 [Sparganum proliferum]
MGRLPLKFKMMATQTVRPSQFEESAKGYGTLTASENPVDKVEVRDLCGRYTQWKSSTPFMKPIEREESSGEVSDSGDECFVKVARTDTCSAPSQKRARNTVWKSVVIESTLNEALTRTDVKSATALSIERDVESYFIEDAEPQPAPELEVDGSRRLSSYFHYFFLRKSAKDRLSTREYDKSIPRTHLGVDFDSSGPEVVEAIAKCLNEDKIDIIDRVVETLGTKRALSFCYLAEDIENRGGFFVADGSRRRTPGGVFLTLIRRSDEVTKQEKKTIFKETDQEKLQRKKLHKAAKRRLKRKANADHDSQSPKPLAQPDEDAILDNIPSPDVYIEAPDA